MDDSSQPTPASPVGDGAHLPTTVPTPHIGNTDATAVPSIRAIPATLSVSSAPLALPRPGFWLSLGITVLLVLFQGIVGVVAVILLIVASMIATGHEPGEAQIAMVLLPVGVMTIVVIGVAAAVLLFGREARRSLAIRGVAWPQMSVILLATPPFLVVAQEIAGWAAEYLPTFSGEMFNDFAGLPVALVLLFGGLGPALGEEIIFRGILGRGLVARHGMWLGGVFTAFFFGLVHVDPAQAVSVLWLGWILQAVYVATRSLIAPMFVHLLNNSLAFLQLKYYDPFADWEHLPLGLIIAAVVALAGLGVLMFQFRSRWILADGTAWSPGYVTAEMPPTSLEAQCHWQWPSGACLAGAAVANLIFWAAFVVLI